MRWFKAIQYKSILTSLIAEFPDSLTNLPASNVLPIPLYLFLVSGLRPLHAFTVPLTPTIHHHIDGIHLKQCVTLYLFALPLTLVNELGWGTIPVVTAIAFTFMGIEGIADEIEMPFGLCFSRYNKSISDCCLPGNDQRDLPLGKFIFLNNKDIKPTVHVIVQIVIARI